MFLCNLDKLSDGAMMTLISFLKLVRMSCRLLASRYLRRREWTCVQVDAQTLQSDVAEIASRIESLKARKG